MTGGLRTTCIGSWRRSFASFYQHQFVPQSHCSLVHAAVGKGYELVLNSVGCAGHGAWLGLPKLYTATVWTSYVNYIKLYFLRLLYFENTITLKLIWELGDLGMIFFFSVGDFCFCFVVCLWLVCRGRRSWLCDLQILVPWAGSTVPRRVPAFAALTLPSLQYLPACTWRQPCTAQFPRQEPGRRAPHASCCRWEAQGCGHRGRRAQRLLGGSLRHPHAAASSCSPPGFGQPCSLQGRCSAHPQMMPSAHRLLSLFFLPKLPMGTTINSSDRAGSFVVSGDRRSWDCVDKSDIS